MLEWLLRHEAELSEKICQDAVFVGGQPCGAGGSPCSRYQGKAMLQLHTRCTENGPHRPRSRPCFSLYRSWATRKRMIVNHRPEIASTETFPDSTKARAISVTVLSYSLQGFPLQKIAPPESSHTFGYRESTRNAQHVPFSSARSSGKC